MRLVPRRALVALLAAGLALTGLETHTALAGCELRPDLNIMALTLAFPGPGGRFVGRWLGAYPIACDGENYVLAITPDALAALEQAAADPSRGGQVFVMGDFPYFGDSVCLTGAIRRWWEPSAVGGGQPEQRWQGANVPIMAPAFPCPINQAGDAVLVLQPGG